jgi:prepilin-type N-terminal cleavage/methylation domain-containing protein
LNRRKQRERRNVVCLRRQQALLPLLSSVRNAEHRRGIRTGVPDGSGGFTLLELLLAVTIMVAVMAVVYLTFSTVVHAWRRGTALVDNLHHGDFALEELTMALRSAYYPDAAKGKASDYGFWMEDAGSGQFAGDTISWVKLGHALVGDDCPFAGAPHRVVFFVEENGDGERVASIKAWRLHGQSEDFDSDEVEHISLSRRITGFSCRPAYLPEEEGEEIEWLDEWENTNEIPALVDLTLYLDPLEEGEAPIEIKRIVRIPTAHLSWK